MKKAMEETATPPFNSIFYSDQPIHRSEEDLFGRAEFAKHIARSIANIPGPESFVFGLSGPWGSGKTSLINMVEHELQKLYENSEKIVVFRFNPWWFSGSDTLLISFLQDFAKVLGAEIKGDLSKKLASYMSMFGHLLKPTEFVPGLDVPAKALAALAASGGKAIKEAGNLVRQDAEALRRSIDKLLLDKKQRVLVIIDDVDRLLPDEVIQIFRIVKAVADFPFVRYLLAYDGAKVCSMVKSAIDIEGREFLDKIIQMPVELPSIAESKLHDFFLAGLDQLAADTPKYLIDATRLGNVFYDGIAPFLTSPRAVKRLLNILRATYPPLKGEVDLADFIAIQAVMIFAPEAYRIVRDESHWFNEKRDRGSDKESEAFLKRWNMLISPVRMESITRLIKRIFPRFETLMGGPEYTHGCEDLWSSRLQVASDRHFLKYFQMTLIEGMVSEAELTAFINRLGDSEATDAWLRGQLKMKGPSGKGTRTGEALKALIDLARSENKLKDEHRARLLESLLRVGDELSSIDDAEPVLGFFPINNSLRLIWILRGLIEGIRDTSQRRALLTVAYEQGKAYVTMLALARTLGSENGLFGSTKERGDIALLDKETCLSLAQLAVAKIKEAKEQGWLDSVPNPMELADLWASLGEKEEAIAWLHATSQSNDRFLAIVRMAVSESHSQGWDDRVARRSPSMAVEYLCKSFNAKILRDRAKTLLQDPSLKKKLDEETIFGLEQLCNRIREDGTVIPKKDNFMDD